MAFRDPQDIARLQDRLFRHWLPDDPDPAALDPETAFDAWRRIVLGNRTRAPEDRQGFLVPYDRKAAEGSGVAVPGVPEEMV